MEKWLKWAIEIQSLAQSGLAYTSNVYDIEKYERLREIAAEMIAEKSDINFEKVMVYFVMKQDIKHQRLIQELQ